MNPAFFVLSIAGSDSGAGAGVQADSRTIEALGGFALNAITAVTAQNTRGVRAWTPVSPALVAAQVQAVIDDFRVGAIKTGLLCGTSSITRIADVLKKRKNLPLVVDPVIGSTSGTRFLTKAALSTLKKRLLPLATVVTPNWPEAAALAGVPVTSHAQALDAGTRLMETLGCAVLVKGGHGRGKRSCDLLVTPSGNHSFEGPRIATRNSHGTGCVLSSAIACGLAQGMDLEDAVFQAKQFLQAQLKKGRKDDWNGRGPAFGS